MSSTQAKLYKQIAPTFNGQECGSGFRRIHYGKRDITVFAIQENNGIRVKSPLIPGGEILLMSPFQRLLFRNLCKEKILI